MSDIDPFADVPAPPPPPDPENVVPFAPPADFEDRAPPYSNYGADTMTAVDKVPLPLVWFDDITEQLTGLWLVKHILPAMGIAVLYGHPGCGKTFLALDWALHIALGWEWHGRKVKQGVVIYVAAEGQRGLQNRVAAFRRHHGVKEVPFALIPTAIDLQAPDADVRRLIDAIRQAEAHVGDRAVMIVIDTLSKTFGAGKENTDDMVTYVANCERVCAEFECLTMAVHHRPKDAESTEPRGHSSLKGGSETVIIVEAGATKKATITKQKDGEDGLELLFRLKVIELGEDEDGDTVTSCVVERTDVDLEPRGHAAAKKVARLPEGAKLALRILDETTEASGRRPPNEIPDTDINRMRVGKVVLIDDWRVKFTKGTGHGPDIKPDTIAKAFRRNLVRLQNDGIVRVYEEYAWRTWESREQAGHAPDTDRTRTGEGAGQTGHSGAPYYVGRPPQMSGPCPADAPAVSDGPDEAWKGNPALNPEWTRGAPRPPVDDDDPDPFDHPPMSGGG